MTFFEWVYRAIADALGSVTASQLNSVKDYVDPEHPHMQIVRHCVKPVKESAVEFCLRFDAAAYSDVGVQDLGVELFSWGLL